MADDQILPLVQIPTKEIEKARKADERRKKQEEKEKERNKKATAKKLSKDKLSKGKILKGPFAFLEPVNEWLEKVPRRIIAAYNNFIGSGEHLAQSKVDQICAWLAWKVNIAVERKRQAILRILYDQNESTMMGKVMKAANAIKKFFNDPLRALGSFAGVVFGPVAAVFAWGIELAQQVIRLGANLANIMAVLPPPPPNPHINYDKFKLHIKGISMKDLTTDPKNLPSPESMFPEPPKPFTKETFKEGFEKASARLKSSQKKYTLSEEDAAVLSGFQTTSLEDIIREQTMSESNFDIA